MRLAIASPLYPPDIAEPAPYVKELAKRLAKTHDVTVVTYGRLPEPIDKVRIVAVSKQQPVPVRLVRYWLTLLRAARTADRLYVLNGPSTELPAVAASFVSRTPYLAHLGDRAAHERAGRVPLLGMLERLFLSRAEAVVGEPPLPRPEILPFEPYPAAAFSDCEASWEHHLRALERALNHA